MRRAVGSLVLTLALLRLLAPPGPVAASPPVGPGQPPSGPGGAATPFARSVATHVGDPGLGVWLFEPADPLAAAPKAQVDGPRPVLIFLSGCCGDPPLLDSCPTTCNGAWLDHLARMGDIVVFPIFRGDHGEEDVAAGVRAALAELAKPGHAPPDLSRVALFGWSWGGYLAADYAATAAANGLPVPAAILLYAPGCGEGCVLRDLSPVPAATRLVMVVGTDDDMAGEDGAKQVWAALPQIPAAQRAYVRLVGDRHGEPPLVTDHTVPGSPDPSDTEAWASLDALDWYGLWRPLDALLTCTWGGVDCDLALGDSPARTFMGTWSDGVPVAPAEVVPDPGPPSVPNPVPRG